jgi:hypothetical protein
MMRSGWSWVSSLGENRTVTYVGAWLSNLIVPQNPVKATVEPFSAARLVQERWGQVSGFVTL